MIYRKIIVLFFFLALVVNSHAQKYSISVSGGFPKFVDPKYMDGTFSGGKLGRRALALEAGYEGFIEKYKKLRLSVVVDYYSGNISLGSFAGYVQGLRYEMECARAGLSISPYRIELAKNLVLSPAIEFNILAINSGTLYTAYRADSSMASFMVREEATPISGDVFNLFTVAGTLNLSYMIPFGNRWYMAPNYRYYHGLTHEFKKEDLPLVSRRHQLGIIVGWK